MTYVTNAADSYQVIPEKKLIVHHLLQDVTIVTIPALHFELL